MSLPSVKDLSLPELEQACHSRGEPTYRARQIFTWIYKRNAAGFSVMSNLGAGLRKKLADSFDIDRPEVASLQTSADGTQKFLLRLRDGKAVESVIIPETRRMTLCVSTQVGCRRGCRLCATAGMGFQRNLTSGEILNQILAANARLAADGQKAVTHLVFMGMGEPMDNLDNLLKALSTIHDDFGPCIGPGRTAVSTVGVIEGLERLAREGAGEGLAISLHASDDATRQKLIPLAKTVSIRQLMAAAALYAKKTGNKVMFEYVMIRGVNCSVEDGKRLAKLLSALPSKINLIPYNTTGRSDYSAPSDSEVEAFAYPLLNSPVIVTRRKSRGQDIAAACGQLCIASA